MCSCPMPIYYLMVNIPIVSALVGRCMPVVCYMCIAGYNTAASPSFPTLVVNFPNLFEFESWIFLNNIPSFVSVALRWQRSYIISAVSQLVVLLSRCAGSKDGKRSITVNLLIGSTYVPRCSIIFPSWIPPLIILTAGQIAWWNPQGCL